MKKETPASVRVARWTAVAAAIAALGTIGNTFIEKRPWFLESAKTEAVVKQPAAITHAPILPSYTESTNIVKFNFPQVQPVTSLPSYETSVVTTSQTYIDHNAVASMVSTSPAPSSVWNSISSFFAYYQTEAYVVMGAIVLLSIAALIEYFYQKR